MRICSFVLVNIVLCKLVGWVGEDNVEFTPFGFVFLFFCLFFFYFFFFQAEDGIRDRDVTGVQTCVFRSR